MNKSYISVCKFPVLHVRLAFLPSILHQLVSRPNSSAVGQTTNIHSYPTLVTEITFPVVANCFLSFFLSFFLSLVDLS